LNIQSWRFEISQSALITYENKLLLLQIPTWKWVFPGWKINVWESWEVALHREILEELSFVRIKILSIIGVDSWMNWEIEKYGVFFHCIPIWSSELKLSNEHINYKWVTREELEKLDVFHEKLREFWITALSLLPLP
jgi:ADP-ribose pyrophosphatase YjhB (NUDIX family)